MRAQPRGETPRLDLAYRRSRNDGSALEASRFDGNICRSQRVPRMRRSSAVRRRAPATQAKRKPDGWSARGRRHRSDPQGLSAPVGDLHRAGAARARAARPRARALFAAPSDRPRDASRSTPRSGRRSPTCPSTCTTSRRASGARGAGPPAARVPRRARRVVARSAARPHARTASAASGRRSCSRPSCRADVVHLHAHFLHTPASVARYAALLRGLRLELLGARQGHLDDARMGEARKARRLRVDDDVHRGQRPASARARRPVAAGSHLDLSRHRHDALSRSRRRRVRAADGRDPSRPGAHPGRGPRRGQEGLRRPAARPCPASGRAGIGSSSTSAAGRCCGNSKGPRARSGFADRVQWRGPQAQAAVLDAYRAADIFALPCRVSADGDRDGLPNVLLEAQSQKLACVSTRVSGIPGADRRRRHGAARRATRARDALAQALVAADRAIRRCGVRLGEAGFARTTGRVLAGRGSRSIAGRSVSRLRVPDRAMKVAFYAPLKSPDHPGAVGRPPARAGVVASAARRGATRHASLALSQLRPGAAMPIRQARIARVWASGWRSDWSRRYRRRADRPDVWFTYHLYHKAPDFLGPRGEPRARHSLRRRRGVRRAEQARRPMGARLRGVGRCDRGRQRGTGAQSGRCRRRASRARARTR